MGFEHTTLNEICRTEKDKLARCHLYVESKNKQLPQTRPVWGSPRGGDAHGVGIEMKEVRGTNLVTRSSWVLGL